MSNQGAFRYVVLVAMSLLYFLLMAGTFNSLGVVLPMMVTDLGMNWAEAGAGFTLLGIACGAASLAPAWLIRRIGVSLTLAGGAVTLVIGFACLALASSALTYHLGTILVGLGFCFCGTVPGIHVISPLFERRSTALGFYFTVGTLGSVFGPLIFFAVNNILHDWRAFWAICMGTAIIFGAFGVIMTRSRPAIAGQIDAADTNEADASGWGVGNALRTPQFWIVVAAYTVCLAINTTVHSFAVQHLGERGLTLAIAAGLMSAMATIGAAGAAMAGVIGERLSPRILTLLALGALAMASIMLVQQQTPVTLGLFTAAMGVGFGFSYVGTAMLLLDYFGRRCNLELYSMMCMISTSAAIGPALGGMQRDYSGNFVQTFEILAAIGLLLFVIVLFTRRPQGAVATAAAVGAMADAQPAE